MLIQELLFYQYMQYSLLEVQYSRWLQR